MPRVAMAENSCTLRSEASLAMVFAEVNEGAIGRHRLIANRNWTTAILVVALEPLRPAFGLKRAIASIRQAVSGAGPEGLAELERETSRLARLQPV